MAGERLGESKRDSDAGAAKARVRAQYGAVGDAYVKSAGHAAGNDLTRMLDAAQPRSTDRVLDIATGGGHVARLLAPHAASVVASDLTPEILDHAAAFLTAQGLDNFEMKQADAEALPFDAAAFNIVTCRIAPHHFPNPAQFVREAARVLAPGGRFVLVDSTVPSGEAGEFLNEIEQMRDPSHVRSLTIDAWNQLIADAGLQIDSIESFSKRHDFRDWTERSRMTDSDREHLEERILAASPSILATFAVEVSDDRLVAFTDEKTLFSATKS
jgi:ubiquinone/menaquinone biosynthesis C-methylase UbiE